VRYSRSILPITVLAVLTACGFVACSKSASPDYPILCTKPTAWEIPKGGGSTWVTVLNCGNKVPIDYSIAIAQGGDWLWTSQDWGSTTDSFLVGADANMDGATRMGRVVIDAPGTSGSPDTIVLTQTRSAWITRQPMPTARHDLAAVALNGKIFAIGGSTGSEDQVEEYDPATDAWAARASMPTPRDQLAAAAVNSKIYVIGGRLKNGSEMVTVEEYDPATDSWATRQPMPSGRSGLAAAVVDDKIYVIGGWDNAGSLNTVEIYDPATNTWTTGQPMPTSRHGLAAAAVNGTIYAIGGFDSHSQSLLSVVEEYNPAIDTWTTRQSMPSARWTLAAVEANGKIYAMGGWTSSYAHHTVEEYDPFTNAWTTRQGMPTPRANLAAAAVGGKVYAIGGYNNLGLEPLNSVEEYDPVLDQ
jgi:N-acetylneuraminic acid mutarotase